MRKLELSKGHIVTSSFKETLQKVKCRECKALITCSPADTHCAFCGSVLPKHREAKAEINASLITLKDNLTLKCTACDAIITTDYDKDLKDSVVVGIFCPACGGEEVEVVDELEDSNSLNEERNESTDDVEDEIESKINSEAKLEAALLEYPELQWILFANGEPILRFKQSAQPEEARSIFASESYINVIRDRIMRTSLTSVAKEFNAEVIKPSKVIKASEISSLAYEELQGKFLPKFIDCINLAIVGMVKNIYPDLSAELKAAMYDELKSRNIDDPVAVIESAFETAGTKVFEAVIAKAMELFNKKDEAREEIKSTILASASIKNSVVSEEDLDKNELKTKLVEGSIPITTKEPLAEMTAAAELIKAKVSDYRNRIKFKK